MVSKAYLNKYYRQLLHVAREIYGSYSMRFDSLGQMACFMEIPYTDTFKFAINDFNKSQYGFIKLYGSRVEVEVIPF